MFSALGPDRRLPASGQLPLDERTVEVEEGQPLQLAPVGRLEDACERRLGDRRGHRARRLPWRRGAETVERHGHVGREHAAEADAERLLDHDHPAGVIQSGADRLEREGTEAT